MSDTLKQVGREIRGQRNDAKDALNRYARIDHKIERVRDVFDSELSFKMDFETDTNSTVTMNIFFSPPPPSSCCSNGFCSACEVFADGEQVITLDRGYIPGSISLFISGTQRTTFEETNASAGIVTITIPVAVGDVVRICYIYGTVSIPLPDTDTIPPPDPYYPPPIPPDDPDEPPPVEPDPIPPTEPVDPGPDPTPTSTYYVDVAIGADTNNGTSLSTPWKTLQHAATVAPSGAKVYVRQGNYLAVNITRPGITFEAYAGDARPIINQAIQFVVNITAQTILRGFEIQGANKQWGAGIKISSTAATTKIDNCIIRNCRSFAMYLSGAENVLVTNCNMSKCDSGVQISGRGRNVTFDSNTIHHMDTMTVDVGDPTRPGSGDRGANAYIFTNVTGPTIVQNEFYYGLRAYSTQFGTDGGAFEFFNCSNVTVQNNRMYDVQNLAETGGDSPGCSNLRVLRNVLWAGPTINVPGPRHGIILRSADNSVVAHNTFLNTTVFAIDVGDAGDFAGTINNLVVKNNLCQATDKMLSIDNVPLLSSGVDIDHNLYYNSSGGSIAYIQGHGNTSSIANVRTWTGYEMNGVQANPLLNGDYTLQAGSPAIDEGEIGVTAESYLGAAPDIGRYEKA